jgi:hypothetical protein
MEVVKFSDLRIGNSRTCLVICPWTTPAQRNCASSTERGSCNLQLAQSFNKSWKTSGVITDSDSLGDPVTLLRVGLPRWHSTRTHTLVMKLLLLHFSTTRD